MSRRKPDIISIVGNLVAQMTPVVLFTSPTVVPDGWKLTTCNTYWLRQGSRITIDGLNYKVVDFSLNSWLTVSGASIPTGTEFSIIAPEYWHGTHRKVSGERDKTSNVSKVFVYLPIPSVSGDDDQLSPYAYTADIKPIFLMDYDPQKDTSLLQQDLMIKPLLSMSDVFRSLIDDQPNLFETLDSYDEIQIPNFGDESVWGKDSLIFNEKISGIQLLLTLQGYEDSNCNTCDNPILLCSSATYKNSDDTFIQEIASGQSFISADITNQINGVDQVAVPSNVPFNYSFECPIIPCAAASYEVEYENGTPISSGTIPSGGSAIITVPNVIVCPNELIYQEARYTGQVVSYGDGDPTWRKDNNKLLALVQPSNGICQRLQSGSNYLLFYDNVFGNKYMITGLTGGYYNPLDGNYYNVTNTIVTRGDVFPTEIGVDHLYNRLVQTLQDGTQKAWLTWLSDGLTLTISGFAEWYLPTINEGLSYADWSNTLPFQNSVPFSWNTAAKLLGDTYLGSGDNQCYSMESYGHIRSIIKTNANKAIYIKPVDINSIFG